MLTYINYVVHMLLWHFRIWYMGLCWILRGLKRQQQLTDRRSRWLKEKYLQLYFSYLEQPMEGLEQPTTADAIRVFGGRDWSMTESIGTLSPTSSSTLRRRNVKGKKTKSIGNIHALTKVRKKTVSIFKMLYYMQINDCYKNINIIKYFIVV